MPPNTSSFTQTQASQLAKLALDCIQREYPNKLDHVINTTGEVRSPRALHPAFYGCFDWHSAVHSHWMLIRLLRTFPALPEAPKIRKGISRNLSTENLDGELVYLSQPARDTFERTYGWAWMLKLTEELSRWKDPDGERWSRNLEPLGTAFVKKYMSFLPIQIYPIRSGTHTNSAFGMAFAWDYAEATGNSRLADLIRQKSMSYFVTDREYPSHLEPDGEDFFSPTLMEADLMRRVLARREFQVWFKALLPDLANGHPENLLIPATVTDRTDGRIVHLDGLNFSRAWCMRSIAAALAEDDPARRILIEAASTHTEHALSHLTGGDYSGEHWLGSFAVYLLGTPDLAGSC